MPPGRAGGGGGGGEGGHVRKRQQLRSEAARARPRAAAAAGRQPPSAQPASSRPSSHLPGMAPTLRRSPAGTGAPGAPATARPAVPTPPGGREWQPAAAWGSPTCVSSDEGGGRGAAPHPLLVRGSDVSARDARRTAPRAVRVQVTGGVFQGIGDREADQGRRIGEGGTGWRGCAPPKWVHAFFNSSSSSSGSKHPAAYRAAEAAAADVYTRGGGPGKL